ncbi:MAG: hypothetical protein QOC77_2794 [Thermoleophilaceae bacterium]|jgi:hypothetical protein|nr:hypothetical protein [Thermoleophilaceae bacterium]MEA2470096.1 hypothetical protein [Thermoleophilaceae bacterium]
MAEEREPEEQVEDLDVPESESEDVKGGAFDAFNKVSGATSFKQTPSPFSAKISPGGLNVEKI